MEANVVTWTSGIGQTREAGVPVLKHFKWRLDRLRCLHRGCVGHCVAIKLRGPAGEAFAGSAWSALKPEGIAALSQTMFYLSIAIFLTGIASSMAYLAQYFFAERLSWHKRAGGLCQWGACALVLAAYVLVFMAFMQAGDMLTMFKVVKLFPAS
jgi:hypothetical protein